MLGELADAVRRGRTSAVELTQAALDRIAARDATINAVVSLRAEEAMSEAADVDAGLQAGRTVGRLAGLPALVKDVEHVRGMTTTFGSLLHAADPPATVDGVVPARLRAEGAIIIGKANTSEFAWEGYTANRLFGSTQNPWNPSWSPGGSSGGSAAALAAGMVPIATGTDGGGSIRVPAALCGLVGLKPSNGIIGRFPIPTWMDLSTDGVLGTTVADVRQLLEMQAGTVPGDPTALPEWPLRHGSIVRRVLATTRLCPGDDPSREIEALFSNALGRLEALLGLPIEIIKPASIFEGGNPDDDSLVIIGAEQVQWIGRNKIRSHAALFDPRFLSCMEEAMGIRLDSYIAARRRRFNYARQLDSLLADDCLLAAPTILVEGWTPDGRLEGSQTIGLPNALGNTAVHNLTGHPAISIPAGVGPHGVPFGLMLTAPRFHDDLLLDVAQAWEATWPWPAAAPGYTPFVP